MKKMTKREQILAQKTIDARRVKNESRSPSRHGGLSQSLSPNKRSHFRSLSGFSNRRPATSMETMNRSFAGTIDEDMFNRSGPPSYRDDNDALTKELAQRGLTHQATVRKMTNEALARTAKQDIRVDDRSDIFLPKVRKVRPDGATLADVYRSKKEDVWGKILREQIAEEERNNIRKRAEKEAADAAYGEKLREQLAIKSHLERTQVFGGDVMANSTGGTWAQFEERNRLREAQRSVKHKQFVENALHDMNVKKKRKEEELQQELESSAYVVRKAQMELEAEKEKARRQKEQQAKEMSRLFEENQAILAKRQREREENHKRDRKYVKELDDKFRIEDERRKAEVDRKAASNSTDRGTFLMAKKIHEEAKRKEQELMETFVKAENSLSRQLKISEESTHSLVDRHEIH